MTSRPRTLRSLLQPNSSQLTPGDGSARMCLGSRPCSSLIPQSEARKRSRCSFSASMHLEKLLQMVHGMKGTMSTGQTDEGPTAPRYA